MKNFFILIVLTSTNIFAQNILEDIDFELGQRRDSFNTNDDSLRFSLSAGTSYQFKISQQKDIDLQLLKKIQKYQDGWIAFQLKRVQATYDQIADPVTPSTSITNPNGDSNFDRDGKIQNISLLGIGYSYRFNFLQEWIDSKRVFESISFFANYVTATDETTDRSYKGYGLTTDFSVHKRVARNFFYGAKISYNLASVIREPIADEPKEERSLFYAWTTLGIELGYFF